MYPRLAMESLSHNILCKNQSEIYCMVASVLLKMKTFKYHASIVNLAHHKFKQCFHRFPFRDFTTELDRGLDPQKVSQGAHGILNRDGLALNL